MSDDPRRRLTLGQFLNEDLDTVIGKMPDGASLWKSLLIHATDHMKAKGYTKVRFSPLNCNAEGYVTGHIYYS